MAEVSRSDKIADIKRVAESLGVRELSRQEYLQHSKYSEYQLYDGGDTWEGLCRDAGIACKKNEPVGDDIYFRRLVAAMDALNLQRYPKTSERKKFQLNFSKRRYPTLAAFIQKAIELRVIKPLSQTTTVEKKSVTPEQIIAPTIRPESENRALSNGSRTVPPIPVRTKRKTWRRTGLGGFPYAPQDESGVVALFAILCSQRRLPWQILELNCGKGIDATCYDEESGSEMRVEIKFIHSPACWRQKLEDIDYIVCWENRWPSFQKPVIVLRDVLTGIP